MERTIRKITDHFVAQLTAGSDYYRIEDLKTCNFPPFLIQRIRIELQWNLDESMILPKTDWANTESETVQKAWQHFLNAIHAKVQLPEAYAKAVIETAVADVIEMLVTPRKNITDILFGGEDELSSEELAERTELLVVYPHFARVLTSYMERKNKLKLRRKQCKQVIEQVDDKVTRNYTPLQWAQMLDPLFTLAGPKIETDLLRLFFEDRNMDKTAQKFDDMEDTINRATFIEALSAPDQPKNNKFDEDKDAASQPDVHKESEQREITEELEPVPLKEPTTEDEEQIVDESEVQKGDEDSDIDLRSEEETEETVHSRFQEFSEGDSSVQTESLSKQEDTEQESLPENAVDGEDEKEQSASLNDIFTSDETEHAEPEEPAADDEAEPVALHAQPEEEEEQKSSIWMRFMQSQELEEEDHANEQNGQESSDEEQEYLDEPVVDLTDTADVEAEELERLLTDQKQYFIDELFDGSAQAYEESLQEIAQKETWKEASKLIEKIFLNGI